MHFILDQLCIHADRALKTLTPGATQAHRPYPPGLKNVTPLLAEQDRAHILGLMKVNHVGEVCAQALYEGQALTASSPAIANAMLHAAQEEEDHLAWCETRLTHLNGAPSVLNPIFYAGSFCLGAVAGVIGDRWSLGFVEETERQVCRHLDSHLSSLPQYDQETRMVLEQMRQDEAEHGDAAQALGAAPLPGLVRFGMKCLSKVMTMSVYRI